MRCRGVAIADARMAPVAYGAWAEHLLGHATRRRAMMDRRRARVYHVALDADQLVRLNAKRFAARGEGGPASAAETAARANIQMEPEDRPPVMLEGLGTGSGDPCGPRDDIPDMQRFSWATPGGGMNRLSLLMMTLNRLDDGFPRSRQQREFHRAFIGASLQNIVGPDLPANLGRLMRTFNMEEMRSDVIVYTARRMGKTMSVGLYASSYARTQPSCQISIYSPGHRASFKILGTIHRMVVWLAGGDEKRAIHRGNAETLQVYGTGAHASAIHAYPSDTRVSRCHRLRMSLFAGVCAHRTRSRRLRRPSHHPVDKCCLAIVRRCRHPGDRPALAQIRNEPLQCGPLGRLTYGTWHDATPQNGCDCRSVVRRNGRIQRLGIRPRLGIRVDFRVVRQGRHHFGLFLTFGVGRVLEDQRTRRSDGRQEYPLVR